MRESKETIFLLVVVAWVFLALIAGIGVLATIFLHAATPDLSAIERIVGFLAVPAVLIINRKLDKDKHDGEVPK